MRKDKKAIKRDILNRYRTRGKPILCRMWLDTHYAASLDNAARRLLPGAVAELVHSGLLEYTQGHLPNLRLTPKGADLIYG